MTVSPLVGLFLLEVPGNLKVATAGALLPLLNKEYNWQNANDNI